MLTKLAISILLLLALVADYVSSVSQEQEVDRLLFVTVTSNVNDDGFIRFNRSIETYKLDLIVLSPENQSKELNKVQLFEKALKTYRNEEKTLIVWIEDSSNAIVNGNKRQILDRFVKIAKPKQRIILPSKTNLFETNLYIGFATDIWKFLKESPSLKFETEFYKVDSKAELIQRLERETSNNLELDVDSNPEDVILKNTAFNSEPVIVYSHDEGGRILLNSMGNYLAKAWTSKSGCGLNCNSRKPLDDTDLPTVLIGLFIEEATPFLEDFFEDILLLNYPREKISLFIHNRAKYHEGQVKEFVEQTKAFYALIQVSEDHDEIRRLEETEARHYALNLSKQLNLDYYLALDSIVRIDEPDLLRVLMEADKPIIAPLMLRPNKLWSNYWGSLTKDYYYSRSFDYVNLVKRERVGIWNVAHIMSAYLINNRKFVSTTDETPEFNYYASKIQMKPAYAFSFNLRLEQRFMFIINSQEFGHLIDTSTYNTSLKHPDFYQLKENMFDWEQHYLHENYSSMLEDSISLEQPCPDVFWFPIVNDLFCDQLIDIMESFGRWSGGTNDDPRLEGGYESVPTRDIHFKQVGLHDIWLTFLREYVEPIQLKEYIGYEHDPPRADLAFVVRYKPGEQDSLQPHHDSSTYTMNIALNEPKKDYEGGGCRFIRYNCSVIESRRGWALLHPGRLTHYHEGLRVTRGTRYILVTFIDP